MKVFHTLSESSDAVSSTAVAIGNFDGIHLGHLALLSRMVSGAKAKALTPTVLTFYPHPVEVLFPEKKLERLSTTSEKLSLLENLGVEMVSVIHFDINVAGLSAEHFVESYLVKGLKARQVYVGYNFRFGKGREGDTVLLKVLCDKYGIELFVEEAVSLNERVSSSLVRQKIREGNAEEAAKLLGRNYRLTGMVKPGDGRGKQLGFPTANLHCAMEKLLPKNGVYAAWVYWQRQKFQAVTNVGVRPTFLVDGVKLVEVHILDFNSRIYDETLELDFVARLRDEMKFDSIESLKTQIIKDIERARSLAIV